MTKFYHFISVLFIMKDSQNTVINTTFGAFPIIMGYFKYIGSLKSKLDHSLAFLAGIISFLILIVKHIWALDIAHFLYVFVYLFTVTFLSINPHLLGLNVLMIGLIILSRYYYRTCILNAKQNNKGFFTELNAIIMQKVPHPNWDYKFSALFIFSIYRFLKYF